jgi:hypothetical protein
MKSQADNIDHLRTCHQRWMQKGNRDLDSPGRPASWGIQQCMQCAYFIRLNGVFGDDYGVCSNPKSKFDGALMFEHDGCESFIAMDET